MRRYLIVAVVALMTTLSSVASPIIPEPKSFTKQEGSFTLHPSTLIFYNSPKVAPLADYLRGYIGDAALAKSMPERNYIALTLDKSLKGEAYRLTVTDKGIAIVAGEYGGLFNGVQSLLQLLPSSVYSKALKLPVNIECCSVDDAPRFAYRGFMLDVARTFISKDDVIRYLDYMAYHKINKLHWHLTDNSGWRVEIKSHPRLAEVGGFRGGDSPIFATMGKYNEKYGGYYTQEEIREIVKYAAVRNIEVIPEIDLPGHSLALARIYPEVLCDYEYNTDHSAGYDGRNVVCATKESNYKLLEEIIAEVASLFPSQYIHIGGDEVSLQQWRKCPNCSGWLARNGYTDAHKLEDLFIERMQKILAKYGKLPAVWNEAINGGGLSKETRVHGWKSAKVCKQVLEGGYRTIFMPQEYFYLDMKQGIHEAGSGWAPAFDVKKMYNLDFVKAGFTAEQIKLIEGVEAPYWSEIFLSEGGDTSLDFIEYMTFPRLCGLAELGWGKYGGAWEKFYATLVDNHYDRMSAMGLNYRIMPPKVSYSDGVLRATVDDNSTIYYRLENSTDRRLYNNGIRCTTPGKYLIWSEYGGVKSPEVAHQSHYETIKPAVTLTSSIPGHPKYGYDNVNNYKTRMRTTRSCMKGDWFLFVFDEPVECRAIEFITGHYHTPLVGVSIGYLEVSEDGKNFTRAGELKHGLITLTNPRPIKAARIVSEIDGNGYGLVRLRSPKIYPKW